MSRLRVLLLPILTVSMLTQPFCCHCFAQMRTMANSAESEKQDALEIDTDSLPSVNDGVCTKKPCLQTPKIDLDHLQTVFYVWHGMQALEAISPCFASLDAHLLSGDSVHCPVWLRFSVLLI